MTAIDVVAVGAEDGVDFIAALRVAGAEHRNADPSHHAAEATETAVAGFEATSEQQAQPGRQQSLRVEQALQYLFFQLDAGGGPARGDEQSVVAAALQGQHR
ncbi:MULTISPECIES: hypothetical protein [Stenotrophomonas maltophilia group]|uniref:hypothetical protein n=1 Tax=Stenotrophomonas maltophilia group TaxID=995085 RepID=UPI00163ACBA3|nr:hypothetical protein [Stenotrophomonas maltophilia]